MDLEDKWVNKPPPPSPRKQILSIERVSSPDNDNKIHRDERHTKLCLLKIKRKADKDWINSHVLFLNYLCKEH